MYHIAYRFINTESCDVFSLVVAHKRRKMFPSFFNSKCFLVFDITAYWKSSENTSSI